MPAQNALPSPIVPMYSQIFAVIAPVFFCAAIGFGWARLKIPYEKEFLSRLVLNVGVPALVIGTLSKVALPPAELWKILGVATLVLSATLCLAWLICRIWKLPTHTYLAPLCFPNTLNMGLPVSYFAFGEPGMVVALCIYLITSLAQFSFGVALVSGTRSFDSLLRSPVILSGLIASGMVITGTTLPTWLQNSLDILGNFVVPLMLITLGVSLSELHLGDARRSLTLGAARIVLGFGVGFAIAELMALEGTLRGVVIIQSTMPAAVFNYILAFNYQRSPESVAGIVVASTLFSFISLPVLLWFLGH